MADEQRGVVIDFEGSVELTESEIWPDGDAPLGWDAHDVAELIRGSGTPIDLITDWGLGDCLTVEVSDDEGETAHPFEEDELR